MTNTEAIRIIEQAISEVEWQYPMEYAVAFEKAIEALREADKKVRCDGCGHAEKTKLGTMYCSSLRAALPPDWFCANGERKQTASEYSRTEIQKNGCGWIGGRGGEHRRLTNT